MLAILALSPDHRRPRRWLEGKLWSGRGPEQAGASLRQTLAEIRKSLQEHADTLTADRTDVALETPRIEVDLADVSVGEVPDRDILEGLQIRDREFEIWLRSKRIEFGQAPAQLHRSAAEGLVLNIVDQADLDTEASVFADIFANEIGQAITERVNAWRRSEMMASNERTPDIDIVCRIVGDGDRHGVYVKLLHCQSGRILFSRVFDCDIPLYAFSRQSEMATVVYPATDQVISKLGEVFPRDRAEVAATITAERALDKMFSFESAGILESKSLLDQSLSTDPNGLFYAWKALATVFEIIEGSWADPVAIREEATCYAHLALEAAPHNALVVSIVSIVRMLGFRELENAQHLVEQAASMNRSSPYSQLALCLASMMSGDNEAAYQASRRALAGVEQARNRHWWDTFHCITSIANNRYEEAIRAGERAVAVAPEFRAPHRHLLPLYASTGHPNKARSTVERLQRLEPGFTLERFRTDPSYPIRTLRSTPLIDFPTEMF